MKVARMEQRPDQPPEGKLIADATTKHRLSIREAARRAGISYGRWRQIATGIQHVSPGNYAAVHAPARTLARMALVVDVTPEQLEAAGRLDAAEALREIKRTESATPPLRVAAPLPATEAMETHLAEVDLRVELAHRRYPGQQLAGHQVFPDDPQSAKTWDDLTGLGWDEPTTVQGLAALRAKRQERAEGKGRRAAVG